MRLIYTRPTLVMLWLSAACLLAGLLAAWLLLQQPWLGIKLQASASGEQLVVAGLNPRFGHTITVGAQALRLVSAAGESINLQPADLIEEPDFLDTYAEMAAFFDRQSALSAMLRSGPVTLVWRVGDHVKNIYRKLNITSRAQAALEALSMGLLRPGK